MSRLGKAKAKEFDIQGLFRYGYRNKEDISNLPPETLIVGSQNVLTNASELVGIRQGYVLDGPAGNQNNYGVDSAYDFLCRNGSIQNLRKWGGNLEMRYQNPVTKAVSWINLLSSLNAGKVVNFTNFFDQLTEQKMFCLMVNGDNNIYEWTGAIGSVASVSNAAGIIATIVTQPNSTTNTSGGHAYSIGDILTVSGGDGTATLMVTSLNQYGLVSSPTFIGGSGYNIGDLVQINNTAIGGNNAVVQVTSINGSNQITGATVVVAGSGFAGYVSYSTTALSGGGSGATTTITLQSTLGSTIGSWALLTNGTGYSAANNIALTGGTGTGATLSITAVGNGSITLQGTQSCSQLGFYDATANNYKFAVLINGVTYTYTISNANGGQTLVGINPDPTIAGIQVGDAVIQVVQNITGHGITTNGSGTLSTFEFDLISTLENQIWYGSFLTPTLYVSQTNNYQSVEFSTPARLPAEGALITLDAPLVGFYPQSNQMYATAGRDQWWVSLFNGETVTVSTIATPTETLSMQRLKTAFNQAAQSQGLIAAYKNSIIFVSNEQIINAFGLVQNVFQDPQMTNMSDPIKYDVDAYNFAGGQIIYDDYFIYVAVPKMGIVRMYNVVKQYWEAPQTLPLSRFYHVLNGTSTLDGTPITLYGHSSLTNESYQLFTGYSDNNNPISAIAAFPYVCDIGGSPFEKKNFNKVYTEGYISSNTTLMLTENYDFGGFSGSYSVNINGNNRPILFNSVLDGSLGQNTLGTQPIGSILNLNNLSANPKFRVINTMPRVNMFEYQTVYSSNDVNQQWALLRFGPAAQAASEVPVEVTI